MPRKLNNGGIDDEPLELDISSLIDVSFLLLIYFLVTSTLQLKEADLQISIPTKSKSSSKVDIDPMNIKVNSDGSVTVNDSATYGTNVNDRNLLGLLDRLKSYKSGAEVGGNEAFVLISPSDETFQQRFIDVLNCLSKVGIDQISLTGFGKD